MFMDILIKNASIIDGSGSPAFNSDIAIKDGKILAIGNFETSQSNKVINAEGQILTPGFIDIHNHSDQTIVLDNRSESQVRQGVTTEVVGLCGMSSAPLAEATQDEKDSQDNKNTAKKWSSFASYLEFLDSVNPATNIACLVGHGPLRTMTMPASSRSRMATLDEIRAMQYELEKCFESGAFGLSTGLEYFPGKAASAYELEQLCSVVAKYDLFHACHIRNRDLHALSGYLEALEIARNSNSKLQISHINPKFGRPEKTMSRVLQMIEWMQDDGVLVGADVIPSIWNHTYASALLPNWALDLPLEKLLDILKNTDERHILTYNHEPFMQLHVQNQWDKIYILDAKKTARYIGMSFADIAKKENYKSGWDALFSLLLEEGEDLHSIIFTGDCFPMEDIMEVLQAPYCSVCSDGVASAIDGATKNIKTSPDTFTWLERFLRIFVLEKKIMTLPEAIRRLTSLPASQAGIQKRGLIKEGYYADITLFNPEKLNDDGMFSTPSKFSISPSQYPTGIHTVIINGQIALQENVRSNEHSGMVLRANH